MSINSIFPLSSVGVDEQAYIESLCEDCPSLMKKKLLALGFIKGSALRVVRTTPLGSPIEIDLMGTRFCLRKAEADCIFVIKRPH